MVKRQNAKNRISNLHLGWQLPEVAQPLHELTNGAVLYLPTGLPLEHVAG
ncbi:MAG TPA: hypothetical protein V6C64_12640 [Microcoleaceae cyanobacterium]